MVEVATTASTSPPEWQKQLWNTLPQLEEDNRGAKNRISACKGWGRGMERQKCSGQDRGQPLVVKLWPSESDWTTTNQRCRDVGRAPWVGSAGHTLGGCSPGLHSQDSAGEALFRCRGSTVTQEGSCRETHWPYSEGGPHRSCHGSSKTCDLGPGDLG